MTDLQAATLWAFLATLVACQLVRVVVDVIRLTREIMRAFRGGGEK